MKIISTNLATPVKFTWNGREETTGIFKKPVDQPLYLTKNDVASDQVSDRLHHGGYYKACYIFSAEQYPYWKELYPHLDWSYGMFGENLTLEGFDETQVMLGDIYNIGDATVQVSQYREPCYKLGHKFGDQGVIKRFVEHGFGGSYLSILEEGAVQTGDQFELLERQPSTISVSDLFRLVFAKEKNREHLKIAANDKAIPHKKRTIFKNYLTESE
jgi:MOSC domain-containing protein YiiM